MGLGRLAKLMKIVYDEIGLMEMGRKGGRFGPFDNAQGKKRPLQKLGFIWISGRVEVLQRSLHFAAGAPDCGAEENAGRSVRDDGVGKGERKKAA